MMKKTFVLTGLMLALSVTSLASHAADKVLTGAFDVGPGGNPQKFNPLTATAGFTWYNRSGPGILNSAISGNSWHKA